MRQIKVFKSIESELWNMEKEINNWAQETGAQIVSVTGNIAPQTGGPSSHGFAASDVLVIVLYEPAA
jgi:hypothetical protein